MEKIAPKDRVPLLGAAIHKARKAQGLSQERLAAMIGTSQNYVSALERGECNVKYIRLWEIADALGVDASELMG
ncbi:helix-turn-helix domain-containing protein [Eggerthella sinensis]|uniref:helix-turn-helix domain-containing protein n=1 Tax=Eggerthella sinensis TaxID=242230 RepID=UPI00248E55CD|nr:helix-turn-helix transcriptional regulator [Eggerthella sinensis]